MKRRSWWRWAREAESGGERKERDERELALLTKLMESSMPRERAHRSLCYGSCSERGTLSRHVLKEAGRRREWEADLCHLVRRGEENG